jgi:hypothetical protein
VSTSIAGQAYEALRLSFDGNPDNGFGFFSSDAILVAHTKGVPSFVASLKPHLFLRSFPNLFLRLPKSWSPLLSHILSNK